MVSDVNRSSATSGLLLKTILYVGNIVGADGLGGVAKAILVLPCVHISMIQWNPSYVGDTSETPLFL